MQIRLDQQTVDLMSEFVELAQKVIPSYDVSNAKVANQMLHDKLREEIDRMKKRGVK